MCLLLTLIPGVLISSLGCNELNSQISDFLEGQFWEVRLSLHRFWVFLCLCFVNLSGPHRFSSRER